MWRTDEPAVNAHKSVAPLDSLPSYSMRFNSLKLLEGEVWLVQLSTEALI